VSKTTARGFSSKGRGAKIPRLENIFKNKEEYASSMAGRFESIARFSEEKKKILSRADMSKKGAVDSEIRHLVDSLNSKGDYCTTSSCAGRITLIERRSSNKMDASWLLSSHQPMSADDARKHLISKHDIWLIQESCIVHVFCRDLAAAERLLLACRRAGLKRSGVISFNKKIMIETMGSEKVETIVTKAGRVLVNDDYLGVLIGECNQRMKRNREKMDKLYQLIKEI